MPYVRLLLDHGSAGWLERGLDELQSCDEWRGRFFSQLHPAAGLGCHPLHVTLLAGLDPHSQPRIQASLTAPLRVSEVCPGSCAEQPRVA